MEVLSHVPAAPLNLFVEKFWLYEGAPRPHAKERLLPTGTTELIINLRENQARVYGQGELEVPLTFPGAIVCGPHSRYFVIDTAEQVSVAGIHFKAGGGYPFFGMPLDELRDQHVALDALWGAWAAELRERVLAAPSSRARFRVMEQALLARARRPLQRKPSVAFALREFHTWPQMQTVGAVTEQTGFSARRFIEMFREEVGLAPKLFCRVRRFQQVLSLITSGHSVRWADVAATCGYFDQAHFIHDFRAFSGLNPSEYPRNLGQRVNHVPILD